MRSYGQLCALSRSLDVVGGRWTLLIVRELLLGPRRYSDLRAALPGIANNLLAERLRELETDGLVRRVTLPPPAAAQVYELTPRGQALEEVVFALIRWGADFMTSRPDDVFRPEWLALVLRAYLPARAGRDERVHARITVAERTLELDSRAGDVRVRPHATATDADVTVAADPHTLLAVASGALPVREARRARTLRIDGPSERVRAAERLLARISPR